MTVAPRGFFLYILALLHTVHDLQSSLHQYCHSLTVSTTQAKIVWILITRHNKNVCRIQPAQICTFSHIGRNLSVLLNNHIKNKLFLHQTILTDCQILTGWYRVFRFLWTDGMLNCLTCRMPPTHTGMKQMWSTQHTAQFTEYHKAVTTAYRMSARSVWLLHQPPPTQTCLWSTRITTGNP